MSISRFSQSRVLVPLLQFPAQRKSIGVHISCIQLRLPRSAAFVYPQSGEFARLAVLRMHRRDTKSQSLEYMGRKEGTIP